MAELSKIRKNGVDYDIKDAAARKAIEQLEQNGVTDEQIASAVEDYFAENPVDVSSIVWRGEWDEAVLYSIGDAVSYNGSSYVCIKKNVPDGIAPDDSGIDWMLLAEKGDPGDDYVLTDADKQEIAEQAAGMVKIPEDGNGLTAEQITALDTMFKVCAFTKADVSAEYNAFCTAFGIEGGIVPDEPDVPDVPEKTLTSISAIYSGGNVPAGTAVTALTGIVVTAHYSDGSTATVTGYTLSGTISEGSNTVTVSYGGKTTTFIVTGIAAEEPDVPVETYTITNNLTNCVSNNSSASINKGSTYTATITANDGYTLDGASVSVVVNGEDITDMAYRNGVITVNNVIGNLVITVVAVEVIVEEVTLLKSITGDGASWIDTEVLPETTHRYEISATLPETASDETPDYFMGCDMYNVGLAYGTFYVQARSISSLNGMLNRNAFTNIGSWNQTEGNLLTNKQAYFVIKDGEQKIYLDAEYTTQQTNLTNGNVVWGSGSNTEVPIIPIYLFRVNYTDQVHPGSAKNYTPATTKFYWVKIYDDATNVLLHEFVPAKQGSKIGMLDTVTQKFHVNKGTGTFAYEEVA